MAHRKDRSLEALAGSGAVVLLHHRSGEDGVCADGKPHDVRLSLSNLGPVGEDGSAVGGPSHLEAPRHALDAFHAKPGPERPSSDCFDETPYSPAKRGTLGRLSVGRARGGTHPSPRT
jgi:hypothetical protein